MSSNSQLFSTPSYPSWVLVEVDDASTPRSFYVIHATQIVGTFNPNIRKVRFFRENRQYPGIVLVVSDHRRYVEQECSRMLALNDTTKNGRLWGLVRIAQEPHKVRLTTINCDRLRCEDAGKDRQTYILEFGGRLVPVAVLHVMESDKDLRDVMAYLKETIFRGIAGRKKLEGIFNLNQAYLLVQYYEDSSNLIFAIVRYSETVWKERNRFPMVVAYIAHGERSCQSIILRMSYNVQELVEVLDEIRNTCDSQDYLRVHAQLGSSEAKTINLNSRLPVKS